MFCTQVVIVLVVESTAIFLQSHETRRSDAFLACQCLGILFVVYVIVVFVYVAMFLYSDLWLS